MGVDEGDLKEEPEDVAVKFAALHSHMVVLQHLVVLVNTSHVLIV